jgi:hypothetical protein
VNDESELEGEDDVGSGGIDSEDADAELRGAEKAELGPAVPWELVLNPEDTFDGWFSASVRGWGWPDSKLTLELEPEVLLRPTDFGIISTNVI